jgi:hypothetical protein
VTRHEVVAPARLGIQAVAEELHRGARRFRLYTARPLADVRPGAIVPLLEATGEQVRGLLQEDRALARH